MDRVQKCIATLKAAKTDTEKCASLLVVDQIMKTSTLTSDQRKEVFNSIEISFLHRLLHTYEVPEGCPPTIFKSVALAVMACFCSDPDLASCEGIYAEIPTLRDIILSVPSTLEEEAMIDDALQCFTSMVTNDKGRHHMLEKGVVSALTDIFVRDAYDHKQAFRLLMVILYHCGSETWENHPTAFTSLMNKLALDFKADNSAEKFELCDTIIIILMKHPNCASQPDEDWCIMIREGLGDILTSKLSKELRDPAIKLSSVMVDKFGVHWLLEESESSKKFFTILVQLVCVEVRMILEDRTVEQIGKETLMLTACYSILECVISVLVEDNLWQWHETYTEQLLASIKSAFNAVLNFLNILSGKWDILMSDKSENAANIIALTFATIRILCAWMAEETFALREEICRILPFALKIAKETFRLHCQKEQNPDSKPVCFVDMMRFLIAPLCHLTADDQSRKVLLSEQLHVILFEYMEYQWTVYQKLESTDLEVLLNTLCGIFLNIVVLESKFVAENEKFFSLLKFLLNALPQLVPSIKHLTLAGNFAVLGLLISKICYKRINSCETSFYKFLSASVKFLWDAHFVEDVNDTSSIVIVREYRRVWSDIMELWFLGMQALTSLLPLIPWIAVFLLESGWPQHIISSLSKVGEHYAEGNIKSTYQAFLCVVVRTCPDAVSSLVDCGILKVCRVHNLKELESLVSP